jgi:hypothetical protein
VLRTDQALSALERARDRLAGEVKGELDAAAFSGTGVQDAAGQTLACRALISSAERLAAATERAAARAGGRAVQAHAEPGVRIIGAPGTLAARTLRDEGCLPWPR